MERRQVKEVVFIAFKDSQPLLLKTGSIYVSFNNIPLIEDELYLKDTEGVALNEDKIKPSEYKQPFKKDNRNVIINLDDNNDNIYLILLINKRKPQPTVTPNKLILTLIKPKSINTLSKPNTVQKTFTSTLSKPAVTRARATLLA